MEKTKSCKDCKTVLPISEFSGRNAMCKNCRNNRDRQTYLKTKKTLEQNSTQKEISAIENLLIDLSGQFSNSIRNHDHREDIMKRFANLSTIFSKFLEDNEILQFKVKISEPLRNYLIKCEQHGIDMNISLIFLRSYQDPAKFAATFGKSQEELQDDVTDDIEEFFEIIQAIKAVYLHWIDSKHLEFGEKLDRRSFSISYHPLEDVIVASNPFGLSNEEFLLRMDKLLQDPPISIKQYDDWNRYQQFKQMIILS